MTEFRMEKDSIGEVKVPASAYFGAQTQRAVENFPVSGLRLQPIFLRALGLVKWASARANMKLGMLEKVKGEAIVQAAQEVLQGRLDSQFVVDVFQAGAGTSQNMNTNEVIANRAIEILGGRRGDYSVVHPNDHVNMAQSTNDVFHTAMHIAALEATNEKLLPALEELRRALGKKSREFRNVVKAGRTHLQDAVPITMGQEFSGYESMIAHGIERIKNACSSLEEVNIGGTAVGTGLNAHPRFPLTVIQEINDFTGLHLKKPENIFEATQSCDAAVEASSALKVLAVSMNKISNDLRLLSSGPRTGLGEILLPAVQPGSSIMPGKVNPVMAEMLNMVCYQVIGNDLTIALAGEAGQLELNVMMPVIAYNLLQSIEILANAVRAFTDRCVRGIAVNEEVCLRYAENSIALATALNLAIGYEKAAKIANIAFKKGKSVKEVALEEGILSKEELDEILDLRRMTSSASKRRK